MEAVLTSIFLALTLLSPSVFPEAAVRWHIPAIAGGLAILAGIPKIREAKLFSTLDLYLLLGFTVSVAVSLIVALHWFGGASESLGLIIPTECSFLLVLLSCRSYARMNFLIVGLFVIVAFIISQGAFAYLGGNFQSPYLLDEHGLYRLRGLGVISDPNDFALFMVTLMPLLWLRWRKGRTISNLLLTLIPTAILLCAIFFTHSRGGAIAITVATLYGFRRKLGRFKSIILTGALAAALVGVNIGGGRGIAEDDGGRIELWHQAFTAFAQHPLFGVGMGQMKEYTDTGQTAHNSYVLCVGELGVFGDYFWLGLLVSNWMGLARIGSPKLNYASISAAKAELDPVNSNSHYRADLPVLIDQSRQKPALVRPGAINRLPALGAVETESWASGPISGQIGRVLNMSGEDGSEQERFGYAAHILRTAFIGLLTGCFFLSRSYSITLYVLLGLSAALRAMYVVVHPQAEPAKGLVLWRTASITFFSIAGLYLFLRIVGALGIG